MTLEALYFCYHLSLLLGSVMHYQSSMQYCPIRTGVASNFTSMAGSPFQFNIIPPGTVKHKEHYQVSLADGDDLPHWMLFRHQTVSLIGLALTEDCGIYHLKVTVTGEECTASLHVHILNPTITGTDPQSPAGRWNSLLCSEKEISVWANLVLQINPQSLNASMRIRLVHTMASHLHQQTGFVSLFSSRKSFILQQQKLLVCKQSDIVEEPIIKSQRQYAVGEVGELLWPVGCQSQEQQADLARVLEHTTKAGVLARLLRAPVLGWRVLCAAAVAQHKVKRDVHESKPSLVSNTGVPPPTQVQQIELSFNNKQEPEDTSTLMLPQFPNTCQTFVFSSLKATSALRLNEHLDTAEMFAGDRITQSLQEVTVKLINTFHSRELTYSQNSEVSNLAHSACQSFLSNSWLLSGIPISFSSSIPHSIYPVLPLTPDSFTVTSTVTHAVFNRESLTMRLTLRPHQKESPIWSGAHRATHSDSESHSTVNSQGQIIYSQDFIASKSSLHNGSSVSHQPLTENYNDVFLLNSSIVIQSPLSSNKIPLTQLVSHVALVSHLKSEQFLITEQSGTFQHLSLTPSAINQEVMSTMNVTIKDTSSTTGTSQPALPGQNELESSLLPSLLYTPEPAVTMLTPPLPSEMTSQGQLDISDKLIFTTESLKPSLSSLSPLQTCITTSLQSDLEMQNSTDFHFHPNEQTQVMNSDIVFTSQLVTHTLEIMQFRSSVEQTLLQTQLYKESQLSLSNSLISLDNGSSAAHTKQHSVHAATMTSVSLIFPLQLSVSESFFNPTTPSTAQEPYTTSSIHQTLSLEPSFPICGLHEFASGCREPVASTYLCNTLKALLDCLSSHLQNGTASLAQYLISESPFSTFEQTSTQIHVDYASIHPEHFSTEVVIVDYSSSNQFRYFMSTVDVSSATPSALPEKNKETAIQQTHSETQTHLYASSISLITYTSHTLTISALNGHCVMLRSSLLICQSSIQDSAQPQSKRSPTQETMGTSFSRSNGILTTLIHTVGQSSLSAQASSSPTPALSSINLPPTILQSIPPLTATVGFPFLYSIPKKTFIDPEDGEADSLSIEMRLIDGPPPSVGSWVSLDSLQLHGIPLQVDVHFAPQHLVLEARDTQGLSAWLHLTLNLLHSPVEPCHVFTLKAYVSLHSILRHRHKVEMLLRKLSGFFNSSSSHHLSIVSVAPGTTVSWYNYSLCEPLQCHVDKVKSMWLAMSSTDEKVNSVFRDAMLPEFPVIKVGPVSYRRDCFSPTLTSTFIASTPADQKTLNPDSPTYNPLSFTSTICVSASTAIISTLQEMNSYQWMAGTFTALLVVCILILIVLLIAAILYFCQRRPRTVAIWPASRIFSVQSKDSRAIRPRRPPLFQPELPPPPLKLWISLTQDESHPTASQQGTHKTPQPHAPKYKKFSNS